jgi:hypothetical protein
MSDVRVLYGQPQRSGRPASIDELVDELTRVNLTQKALACRERALLTAILRLLLPAGGGLQS